MTYKTILVHCNNSRHIGRLIHVASNLAASFQSHLIGLSVVPPVSIVTTGALEAPPVIVDAHCEIYRKDAVEMRRVFEQETANFSTEWRDVEAGPFGVGDVVVNCARSADLVIASQMDVDWAMSGWLDVVDRLAIESGRPVLIMPNAPLPRWFGSRVLVAWNGRREAARAVFDALPVLKQAQAVKVVRVTESEGQADTNDICIALQRHGVKCGRTERIAPIDDVGGALLAQASEFDADLVVMGCYGHSRFREFAFGGASRTMLREATVPILMSH
jgi:nucleotide-binding universal stress UspA family protein